MSGAIDFGTVAALLAVSATVTALVAWQYGNTAPGKMRGWLGLTAISLELLAAGLAVHWALKNGSDGLFTVLFCAGVIGLAVAKATLLPGIVAAYRQGDKGALAVGSVAAFGAYAVIYLLGAMSGLESDAGKTAQAISQSAPLQAIDAEIATTRERLRNLAGFSDAGQAAKEETALQAQAQAQAEKISDLQTALETAQREMAKWANPDCAPKADGRGKPYTVRAAEACAAVQQAQARLDQAQAAAPAGSSYLARHGEYAGVQQHLVALEKRRAEMLTTDNTAAAGLAVGTGDRMLAWLFGLNEEKARSLKWLFLVGIFDILSGLIRLFSEMTHGSDDPARHSLRRFGALLSAGFHPEQAAAILAQGAANSPAAIPPAKVLRPGEELPALDTGAKVLEDGLAILHKGERVLNVAAVEALEKLHPGLLDRANAGVPVGTIEPANGSNKPDNGTIKPKSIKRGGTLEPQAVRQRFDTTSEPGTVRHRYDYVKALILDGKLKGEINPRRIRDIPYNGTRMGHAPAKRFYHQLVKEGVIKDESGN